MFFSDFGLQFTERNTFAFIFLKKNLPEEAKGTISQGALYLTC